MLAQVINGGPLYNFVGGSTTEEDRTIHRLFESNYQIIDVPTSTRRQFTLPRAFGSAPGEDRIYRGSQCVSGEAVVAYIVGANGIIRDPHLVSAAANIVGEEAVKRTLKWHFRPATVDDKAIDSIAVTKYRFACPSERN
jgi:hypothetical protein